MYVSAGGPYPNNYPSYRPAAFAEREQLRRTSNNVCWTALAGILLMVLAFPAIGRIYLESIGYSFSGSSDFEGMSPILFYIYSNVNYLVGMALPALLYFAVNRFSFSGGLPFRRVPAGEFFAYVMFGCMVCILANYPADLVARLEQAFGFNPDLPASPLTNDPRVLALYALSVVVVPPMVEEIMFRGVILQSLRRYGDGFAVLVSAMLFGMYHGNFVQIVFAFISGLALGFVVIRTNSLLPAMLIHALNNGVSLAVELVTRFYGQAMANYVDNIATIVLVALGAAALCWLLLTHRLFSGKRSASVLSFSARMGAAFGNFGGVAFIAYALAHSFAMMTRTHG